MRKEPSKFKKFMFRIFETHDIHDPLCMILDVFYILLILLSLVLTILEAFKIGHEVKALEIVEYVIVGFFTLEWFSSLYTADIEFAPLPYWKAKLRWIFSVESICDIICLAIFIISFLPFKNMSEEVEMSLRLIVLIKFVRLYKYKKYIVSYKKTAEEDKAVKEENCNKNSPNS
ncbi:MAG: ion transporter [Bacilli bacterium]|nr:ion transporter [Bacilli bacterium]